jgi:transcriptional regulator with XRE-family HTH domain
MTNHSMNSKFAIVLDPAFGPWLKKTRAQLGWTQESLAAATGLNDQLIRGMERGTRHPYTLYAFVKLAEVLSMELGYLLHKAGLDVGREGLSSVKLQRAEQIADAFEEIASTIRAALAEGINVLNPHLPPADKAANAKVSADMGVALGVLDVAESRLRHDGWIHGYREPAFGVTVKRPWSARDDDFLREHTGIPHEEVARMLNRSIESVRNRRTKLLGTSVLKGEA